MQAQPTNNPLTPALRRLLAPALALIALLAGGPATAQATNPPPPEGDYVASELALKRVLAPFTGDLEQLRERGLIRILVPLERPDFYLAGPVLHGFEHDLGYQYEVFLSKQRQDGEAPLTVVFVPVLRTELLPALLDGRGDIAAGGLKIDPAGESQARFTQPYLSDIQQVLVTRRGRETLPLGFQDLIGQPIHAPASSLLARRLRTLSNLLEAETGQGLDIRTLPYDLKEEALLRRVARGEIDWALAHRHTATAWAQALPELQVLAYMQAAQGLKAAWAVRPDNPQLLENLNQFMETAKQGTLIGNVLIKRYYQQAEWLNAPPGAEATARLHRVAETLRQHARAFGFDWLAVMAQAYQESRLDHTRVSHANARGLLQVRPSTAQMPEVGIPDIRRPERNVEAGLKYLRHLLDNHYPAKWVKPESRFFFALAAYNAGPTKISKVRKLTTEKGRDPQRWFGQTEAAAQQVIGNETVHYVGYILRYYLAYKKALELDPEFRDLLWSAERERLHALLMGRALTFAKGVTVALCVFGLLSILAVWWQRWRQRGPIAG